MRVGNSGPIEKDEFGVSICDFNRTLMICYAIRLDSDFFVFFVVLVRRDGTARPIGASACTINKAGVTLEDNDETREVRHRLVDSGEKAKKAKQISQSLTAYCVKEAPIRADDGALAKQSNLAVWLSI